MKTRTEKHNEKKLSDFQVMLASAYDEKKLKYPMFASPKLDGIRCFIQDGVAYTRNGKPVRNGVIQSIIGHSSLNNLDGELIVGSPTAEDAFRVSTSGVMAFDGDPDFTFHIFDCFDNPSEPFYRRLTRAIRKVKAVDDRQVVMVDHEILESLDHLNHIEAHWLGLGYEGVMVRDPDGHYKNGRSTANEGLLLKVKRFSDDEAVVVGYEEEISIHGEPKGRLGKFICRSKDGFEFGVGTGFNADDREMFWEDPESWIGSQLKYKHFAIGKKDAPRFPVFLGMRHENDM